MTIDINTSPEFAAFAQWLAQHIEPDQWHTFSMRVRAVEGAVDTADHSLKSTTPSPIAEERAYRHRLQRDERDAFKALMSTEVGTDAHVRATSYLAGLRHALAIFEEANDARSDR